MLKIIESEEREKKINWLKDVKSKYIALVKHGANREPWKVLKSEEGGNSVSEFVQSLIVPTGFDLASIAKQEGFGWVSEANLSNARKYESFTEYVQEPSAEFDDLKFYPLGKSGVVAIIGTPKQQHTKADMLTVPSSAMEAAVAQEKIPVNYTAGDLFRRELEGFVGTVNGVASQSGYGKKQRTRSIMDAYKALGGFLQTWCDALPESEKVDLMKGDIDMTKDELLEVIKTSNKDHVEKLEQVVTSVADISERMTKLENVSKEKEDNSHNDQENKDQTEKKSPTVAELQEKITNLEKEIGELKSKSDHDLDTDSQSQQNDGEEEKEKSDNDKDNKTETKKWDEYEDSGVPQDEREGVFGNLIFDQKVIRKLQTQ